MDFRAWPHLAPFAQPAEGDPFFGHLGQFHPGRAARAVENHRGIAARHAQHLRSMTRLGFGQIRRVPIHSREKKTCHDCYPTALNRRSVSSLSVP